MIRAISVFRVKFNVKFTRPAENFSVEPGSLLSVGMGLLRVGSLLSEGLLFSGACYLRDLIATTIFDHTFGGSFLSQVYCRCLAVVASNVNCERFLSVVNYLSSAFPHLFIPSFIRKLGNESCESYRSIPARRKGLVHISSLSVFRDIMQSVVRNITQHARMEDDINPELNELLKRLYTILIYECNCCLDNAKVILELVAVIKASYRRNNFL